MNIIHLFGFELLRDGGSLIASFQADDSCEYWVMFPKVAGDLEFPVYGGPALVNRTTGIEVLLSNAAMKAWLDRLHPLISESIDLPHRSFSIQEGIARKMYGICNGT